MQCPAGSTNIGFPLRLTLLREHIKHMRGPPSHSLVTALCCMSKEILSSTPKVYAASSLIETWTGVDYVFSVNASKISTELSDSGSFRSASADCIISTVYESVPHVVITPKVRKGFWPKKPCDDEPFESLAEADGYISRSCAQAD